VSVSSAGGLTILCIATYEKGQEFLRECARQGHRVLLLTADTLRDADWPRDAISEVFYVSRDIGREDLMKGVSHVARTRQIDRIVPLDDFDVETAARAGLRNSSRSNVLACVRPLRSNPEVDSPILAPQPRCMLRPSPRSPATCRRRAR
jgi:hypothetical protein